MDTPQERTGAPIRVALVDDQDLVRTGFRMVLDAQPGIRVVGEAADGDTALELLGTLTADVVLMDVRMPRLDGVETTRRLHTAGGPRVLILTTFDLDEYAYAALRAGAGGFLLKDARPEELISAIRSVHSGEAVVAPSTTRRLIDRHVRPPHTADAPPYRPERLDALTPREREVLTLVARGLSNTEIADRLFVSVTTVKTHVGRILTKLGLRDRVQAVVVAHETGLADAHRSRTPAHERADTGSTPRSATPP